MTAARPLRLVPGRKERLGDQLYGQILEQIVSGTLPPGARLPAESRLCQMFGVSRPVVREALMRLQADGLVLARQGSGTYVQKRPPGDLTRLADTADIAGLLRTFEVRMAIEGTAAALAAQRRTQPQLERIRQAMAAMRRSVEGGVVPDEEDFAFHLAIAEASGNELFAEILTSLRPAIFDTMAVGRVITEERSRDRSNRLLEEHGGIADAIEVGDPQAADLAMRYHLHRTRQRLTDRQRDL